MVGVAEVEAEGVEVQIEAVKMAKEVASKIIAVKAVANAVHIGEGGDVAGSGEGVRRGSVVYGTEFQTKCTWQRYIPMPLRVNVYNATVPPKSKPFPAYNVIK